MTAAKLWRLLSLAALAVAAVILTPSCFDSDECTADPAACEESGTTGTDTGTVDT
jgi:hypothetical protein